MEALYTGIRKCQSSTRVAATVTGIPIFKLILVALSPCWLPVSGKTDLPKAEQEARNGYGLQLLETCWNHRQCSRKYSLCQKRMKKNVTVEPQACFSVGPEHQEETGSRGAVGLTAVTGTNTGR